MTTWAQLSEQARLTWLLALFLTLCVQLYGLIFSREHRGGWHWKGSAMWLLLLLSFLFALYDCPKRLDIPLWSLGLVLLLAAAAAAASLYSGIRHGRRRITRVGIREGMDDLPMAGCYFTPRGTLLREEMEP